jgi:hypothetical protein
MLSHSHRKHTSPLGHLLCFLVCVSPVAFKLSEIPRGASLLQWSPAQGSSSHLHPSSDLYAGDKTSLWLIATADVDFYRKDTHSYDRELDGDCPERYEQSRTGKYATAVVGPCAQQLLSDWVLTSASLSALIFLSVAPTAASTNTEGEALDSEEYCRQLLTQALELTQNENLRMSLQEIIDIEFGGGSKTIDLSRLTTAEVCLSSLCLSLSLLTSFLGCRSTKIL